jgi:hypothetical protein
MLRKDSVVITYVRCNWRIIQLLNGFETLRVLRKTLIIHYAGDAAMNEARQHVWFFYFIQSASQNLGDYQKRHDDGLKVISAVNFSGYAPA